MIFEKLLSKLPVEKGKECGFAAETFDFGSSTWS
jgi:hypothetical protein